MATNVIMASTCWRKIERADTWWCKYRLCGMERSKRWRKTDGTRPFHLVLRNIDKYVVCVALSK